MSDKMKTRYPRAEALKVAAELCQALKPACDRLIVAGSLRRGKLDVGDVEILYIPKFEDRKIDLLTVEPVNLAECVIADLLLSGTLLKRPSKSGSFSWGAKNKLAIHSLGGIPVDLFASTESNWFNYLVCRTGPSESNIRIASAAKAKGWQWNPYSSGFTRDDHCEAYLVTREKDVFDFVSLPYYEPRHRR